MCEWMNPEKYATDRLFSFDAEELVRGVFTSVNVAERSGVASVTWYKRDTIHLVHVQHFLDEDEYSE